MTLYPEEHKAVFTTVSGKTRELDWEKPAASAYNLSAREEKAMEKAFPMKRVRALLRG